MIAAGVLIVTAVAAYLVGVLFRRLLPGMPTTVPGRVLLMTAAFVLARLIVGLYAWLYPLDDNDIPEGAQRLAVQIGFFPTLIGGWLVGRFRRHRVAVSRHRRTVQPAETHDIPPALIDDPTRRTAWSDHLPTPFSGDGPASDGGHVGDEDSNRRAPHG